MKRYSEIPDYSCKVAKETCGVALESSDHPLSTHRSLLISRVHKDTARPPSLGCSAEKSLSLLYPCA